MSFINYLSERPKLTQFGIVLIVFFILMSMTGLYHDLIVERHLFAKSVVKGPAPDRLIHSQQRTRAPDNLADRTIQLVLARLGVGLSKTKSKWVSKRRLCRSVCTLSRS